MPARRQHLSSRVVVAGRNYQASAADAGNRCGNLVELSLQVPATHDPLASAHIEDQVAAITAIDISRTAIGARPAHHRPSCINPASERQSIWESN